MGFFEFFIINFEVLYWFWEFKGIFWVIERFWGLGLWKFKGFYMGFFDCKGIRFFEGFWGSGFGVCKGLLSILGIFLWN